MPQDDNTKTVKIYTLSDPRSGEIRYVGKTTRRLDYRLSAHLSEAVHTNSQTHKTRWIQKLIDEGCLPEIELLEECSNTLWIEREQHWIAEGKRLGWCLTNATNGGEGASGYIPTEEVKAKWSQSRLGNQRRLGVKHTEETKQKIGNSSRGRKFSEDHKEKISAAQQGASGNNAKLSEEDVRDIRKRIVSGETQRSLAIEYGVGFPTINKIHLRQRWKHVKD